MKGLQVSLSHHPPKGRGDSSGKGANGFRDSEIGRSKAEFPKAMAEQSPA